MLHEYLQYYRLETIIMVGVITIGLPLWFHIFMAWTTRRRKFVGKEFYHEVNLWLDELKQKYAAEKSSARTTRAESKVKPSTKASRNRRYD